jgi:hypothetical protein
MKINENLWSQHQYEVLVSFIHHLAYYRALSQAYKSTTIKSEFWTKTIDAHVIRSVLDWCMVFGTDSNKIHWKKVITDKNYQSEFRSILMKDLNISETELKKYWKEMTTFRNDYVAHRMAEPSFPKVPFFDTALKIACLYDDYFRKNVNASFEDDTLSERYERLLRTSKDVIQTIVASGPTVEEEYEGNPPATV